MIFHGFSWFFMIFHGFSWFFMFFTIFMIFKVFSTFPQMSKKNPPSRSLGKIFTEAKKIFFCSTTPRVSQRVPRIEVN